MGVEEHRLSMETGGFPNYLRFASTRLTFMQLLSKVRPGFSMMLAGLGGSEVRSLKYFIQLVGFTGSGGSIMGTVLPGWYVKN